MADLLRSVVNVTRIAFDPPRPQADRAGLALVAIVKNEARYVAEWAAFHRAAGVAQFIVYDNGSSDATRAELARALPADRLVVIPWDQKFRFGPLGSELHNQILAYAHATRNFGGRFRWMTWIDVDEFLVPVDQPDLNAALAPLADHAMVSLPWHMFGRNGHASLPASGIVPGFLTRHPDPMADRGLLNFKVIADPCQVTACKVHWMELAGGATLSVNDRGQPASLKARRAPGFYSADRIQLNHYYTRSAACLEEKLQRGKNLSISAAHNARRVMAKVARIEAAGVQDTRAAQWWAAHGGPVSG